MEHLSFRKACKSDERHYFYWINDSQVREQSFNSNFVNWEEHVEWFSNKLNDKNCHFYLFKNIENQFVGQVRIQKTDEFNAIISISVDSKFRGLGYGSIILKLSSIDFLESQSKVLVNAFIKEENVASKIIFEKAGFTFLEIVNYQNFKSFHYVKNADREI